MGKKNKKSKTHYIYLEKEKSISVTEDWFPCYNGNEIKVKIVAYYNSEITFRSKGYVMVLAHGADDFGFERCMYSDDITTIMSKYYLWADNIYGSIKDGTCKQWFIDNNFIRW